MRQWSSLVYDVESERNLAKAKTRVQIPAGANLKTFPGKIKYETF